MSALFLAGNVNQETFANAALAAHIHDTKSGGVGLSDVLVLHSPESEVFLNQQSEWKDHLFRYGLSTEVFVNCCVDLSKGGKEAMNRVARHVERFLRSVDHHTHIYVDLTNGTSLYKSVLSNIAFLVGIGRQYVLDTRGKRGYLRPDELTSAFIEMPSIALLDPVASVCLTEVRRFLVEARDASQALKVIGQDVKEEVAGFEGNIEHAVKEWFEGKKKNDGVAFGGAVQHLGRAFEDLIRTVHMVIFKGYIDQPINLGPTLEQVRSHVFEIAGSWEPELLKEISQFLLHLRNKSTHEHTSHHFGDIRARLGTELLLATTDYFKVLHENGMISKHIDVGGIPTTKYSIDGRAGQSYYFGLDGDDTGRELEQLFQSNAEAESFSRYSKSIDAATKQISKMIEHPPIEGKLLFCSGDDVLFRGKYDRDRIEELRSTYTRISGGHTCSVGFGLSPREAYVALKIAKAHPGKDSVRGVELVNE